MKKTTLLLIFLLCAAWTIYSQPVEQENNRNLRLGLSFSPDYSSTLIKSTDPSIPDFMEDYFEPDFGYTTGLNLSYQLNDWLGLGAGLHFANKGFKSPIISLTDINSTLLGKGRFYEHFYYLDIPLTAKFYIINKKIRLFASAGLSPSIYLDYNSYIEIKYENGEEKTEQTMNPMTKNSINLVMLAGLGIDYAVSDQLSVLLQPIYRRSLTPINSDPMEYYLWSIGVNAGVYYRF